MDIIISNEPNWTDVGIFAAYVGLFVVGLLTFGVVLAAAVIGLKQLDSAEKTREGQLMADLSRRWDEGLILQARSEVSRFSDGQRLLAELLRLDRMDPRTNLVYMSIANFFEDVGILVCYPKKEVLSADVVAASLQASILLYWGLFEPYADHIQGYEWFRQLEKAVRPIDVTSGFDQSL